MIVFVINNTLLNRIERKTSHLAQVGTKSFTFYQYSEENDMKILKNVNI